MPNGELDDELFKSALARTHDCPPLETLERLLQDGAPAPLQFHVDACPHCQTELQMLRAFTSNEVAERERAAVDSIAARLRTSSTAFAAVRQAGDADRSWWKTFFASRWLTPAAAGLAVALAVVGVTFELHRGEQPSLATSIGAGEVLRSSAIAVISPIGDVSEKPAQIRWESAPNAIRYRVQVMEVDHTELWSGETPGPRVDLPASVEASIVPAKTLLIQIAAFDASGNKVAESEIVRFRLLQNLHTH